MAISDKGYVETTRTTPASNANAMVVRQVGISTATAAGDTMGNPTVFQSTVHNLVWNETTWERERSNTDGTALSITSRATGTADSGDLINYVHRGALVFINYSTGQANLVLRVLGKDALSGSYYPIITTASISATGGAAFEIYPGVSAGSATPPATGGQRSAIIPRTWRVTVLPSASATATFGVGYSLIK